MSHAAMTASSGLSPGSFGLDAFGYPPRRRSNASYTAALALPHSHTLPPPNLHTPNLHTPNLHTPRKKHKPNAPATDDEDVFSLDMVTMDMGFEQAYYMYMLMQQKSALVGVEELQRAQTIKNSHSQPDVQDHNLWFSLKDPSSVSGAFLLSPPGEALEEPFFPAGHAHHTGAKMALPKNRAAQSPHHVYGLNAANEAAHSQPAANLISNGSSTSTVAAEKYDAYDEEDSLDEMDQFFSSTESNALDKFLDSLASSHLVNPLDLYSQGQPAPARAFNSSAAGAATQDPFVSFARPLDSAQEIGDSSAPNMHSIDMLHTDVNAQLPTPHNSRQVSTAEQGKPFVSRNLPKPSEPSKRKKSPKPLLSLAQKRLNHSHSEQKRRLVCKQAYERCVRLVTNVDDYKNDLVMASASTSSRKNSKRKQFNKDGLPNLSKHAALLKISREIIKIRDKNEKLRKLLATHS